MDSTSADDKAVLVKLGLTISEAKVYLVLAQMGSVQTGIISKESGIYRQHVCHALKLLEEKGLVEKELGKIPRYKAAPINEALNRLMKRKKAQIRILESKVKTIEEKVKNAQKHIAKDHVEKNYQFIVVPGKQAIINKLRMALQKAQVSTDVITTEKRFSSAVVAFAEDYQNALNRGVKIRIATEDYVVENLASKMIHTLGLHSNFKVKYLPPPPPQAIVSIIDDKEASVTISATANFAEASALWSNDKSFIAVIKNYFEDKWKIAYPKMNADFLKESKDRRSCKARQSEAD